MRRRYDEEPGLRQLRKQLTKNDDDSVSLTCARGTPYERQRMPHRRYEGVILTCIETRIFQTA